MSLMRYNDPQYERSFQRLSRRDDRDRAFERQIANKRRYYHAPVPPLHGIVGSQRIYRINSHGPPAIPGYCPPELEDEHGNYQSDIESDLGLETDSNEADEDSVFRQFERKIPLELRGLIYSFALPDARLIRIGWDDVTQACLDRYHCPSPLLSLCRESRYQFLRYYSPIPVQLSSKYEPHDDIHPETKIYVDYRRDFFLHNDGYNRMAINHHHNLSRIGTFLRERVQNMIYIVDQEGWSAENHLSTHRWVEEIKRFPRIRNIHMVALSRGSTHRLRWYGTVLDYQAIHYHRFASMKKAAIREFRAFAPYLKDISAWHEDWDDSDTSKYLKASDLRNESEDYGDPDGPVDAIDDGDTASEESSDDGDDSEDGDYNDDGGVDQDDYSEDGEPIVPVYYGKWRRAWKLAPQIADRSSWFKLCILSRDIVRWKLFLGIRNHQRLVDLQVEEDDPEEAMEAWQFSLMLQGD